MDYVFRQRPVKINKNTRVKILKTENMLSTNDNKYKISRKVRIKEDLNFNYYQLISIINYLTLTETILVIEMCWQITMQRYII